ncbi:hypothetical protein RHMOL_Rhmol10G0296700 [Rhododendron molle]|uniref:Uncharacterized protein n=1 Tax=Rhododendron molle TaxID=49168 RepID=A0ACC0M7K8_RHOML|nr:hypothetical protein RHMOL_Rhmol10G0296700 [Rhododendron molle]
MATASNNSPDPAANSPRSKRATAPPRGAAPPPWSQLVRGAESEPLDAPSSPSAVRGPIGNSSPDRGPISNSSSPDHYAGDAAQADYSDSNAGKKQVWNKPSNGAVEAVGGAVMGAVSWPALSESTRASLKSASSDSLKPPLSDPASVSASQGAGIASSSTQKSVITNNANPTVTPNHVMPPTRQKSMKKVGGGSSGNANANGGFPQPPPPSVPIVEMPSTNAGRSGLAVPESSPRDHTNKESGQRGGFGSQSHGGNDHPQQRNSYRRGNGGGPYPRGDGSYQQNYRGRRDQDGGNHEWNSPRSFSGRDAHMHPQRVVPRGFIRPSTHNPTPFIPPPPPVPVQPFGNPIIYPEMPSPMIYVPAPHPDSFRGMPVVAQMPPHAMFFPMPDQLRLKIMSQIDYYFSNENLIRDTYLRRNMDEQGWVPINLIAGFAKVKLLTDSIPLILDALRYSNIVEVKFPNVSSPQSLGRSSHDILAANIQSMSLDENMNKQGQEEGFLSRSSSGELNSHSQRSSGEGIGQAAFQAGEPSYSARSK